MKLSNKKLFERLNNKNMSEILTGDIVFDMPKSRSLAIKVIGVGGGGSNAVNYMYEQGIAGVDFVICNTDAQALANSPVPTRIQLGQAITEGLGAGANPEVGEKAAEESVDDVRAVLDAGTKMVFVTAGMGGGTGTGAAPVIAGIAKEMGILTVGIVTAPFYFEGRMRLEQAERGIEKLRKNVDSLIVINNDKLRELYGNLGFKSGFSKADEVLTTAAKGIAEVITQHYAMNIDLRDARTVLANSGTAIMGSAKASGENKAKDAISAALDSPLLNNNKITGAKNVLLLLLSGNNEITMDEIGIINDHIQNEAGNSANIIMGIGEDPELGDAISVTIVATGFPTEDQTYTGKEEVKIVHALEEEQPIHRTLATENPIPMKVNPISLNFGRNAAPAQPPAPSYTAQSQPTQSMSHPIQPQTPQNSFGQRSFEQPVEVRNGQTRYTLTDDEVEPVQETRRYDDFEPRLKDTTSANTSVDNTAITSNNSQNSFNSYSSNVNSSNNQPQNSFNNYEAPQSQMFNINDVPSIQQTSAQEFVEEVNVIEEVQNTIMGQTIDDALNQTVENRRDRLRQFNFKFNSQLSNQQVDEYEAIPAYQRQGVELNNRNDNRTSDLTLGSNNNNEPQIRPNNFLHDNVD